MRASTFHRLRVHRLRVFVRSCFLCRRPLIATMVALAATTSCAQEAKGPRFESEILKFEEQDRLNRPAPDGVLFLGSSSVRLWNVKKSFPDLPAINRGFGGSHVADCVRLFDRVVLPYRPKVIVFYAGDNDIGGKKSPEEVIADFGAFVAKTHAALPPTKIIFVSIKPSIKRWGLIEKIRAANAGIVQLSKADPLLIYAEIHASMLNSEGQPRADLLKSDGLHMTEDGYAIWTSVLTPMIETARKDASESVTGK